VGAVTTQVERLVRVEEQVQELKDKVDKMDKKLDDLLALRNKGAGVLWFIGGAGLILFQVIHYFLGGK
jgi:hypothetical protein